MAFSIRMRIFCEGTPALAIPISGAGVPALRSAAVPAAPAAGCLGGRAASGEIQPGAGDPRAADGPPGLWVRGAGEAEVDREHQQGGDRGEQEAQPGGAENEEPGPHCEGRSTVRHPGPPPC
ncbi:hypothetical protein GCM10009579_51590 [Streptomyces javensis]|uniref:Uncharacterized protein n=1 Tax=Streptomyces javensis TaxID=114698 RepID=A0ABP4HRZ7_9ACTN